MDEDVTQQLSRLQELRVSGAISEEEFRTLKERIISDNRNSYRAPMKEIADEDENPRSRLRAWAISLGILIACAGAALAYPLVNEGAGNHCSALEQGALRIAGRGLSNEGNENNALAMGFITLLQRASNGAFASSAAKARNPNLPPFAACTIGYYRLIFHSSPGEIFGPDLRSAKKKELEFLRGTISPNSIDNLSNLACRNMDRIVRLNILVKWPEQTLNQEDDGYRRLVFSDSSGEYLFPRGTFSRQQGGYVIRGYFTPKSGGMHQGITSIYFEPVNGSPAAFRSKYLEVGAKSGGC